MINDNSYICKTNNSYRCKAMGCDPLTFTISCGGSDGDAEATGEEGEEASGRG